MIAQGLRRLEQDALDFNSGLCSQIFIQIYIPKYDFL